MLEFGGLESDGGTVQPTALRRSAHVQAMVPSRCSHLHPRRRWTGRCESAARNRVQLLGNTAALAEGGPRGSPSGESIVAPEIGGEELVGTVGARYHAGDSVVLSLGVSYDNNRALQVHLGLSLGFR